MESVLSIVRQVPGDGFYGQILDNLKSKTDVILSVTTVGTGVLLSQQADHLVEAVFLSFANCARAFLLGADADQAKVVHKEVSNICAKLVFVSFKLDISMTVIRALRNAVDLIAPSESCLTPAHTYLLQACIGAQNYSYAADFIRSREIFEVNPGKTSLTVMEYLKYFYYAGECLAAVKQFPEALEALTQAIVTPASALSQIVVCAIKKAKLISLISSGTPYSVSSKALSGPVSRYWAQDCPVYDDIERCFRVNDATGLAKVVNESGAEQLHKDLNRGLAQQVLESHIRHRIRNLTKTYLTLSLTDIAAAVESADIAAVRGHLLAMIRRGEIQASIDATTSMVRFGEVSEGAARGQDHLRVNAALESALEQSVALSDRLRDMHKVILTSNTYLLKSVPGGSDRGGRGGGWAAGVMDRDFDGGAMDFRMYE